MAIAIPKLPSTSDDTNLDTYALDDQYWSISRSGMNANQTVASQGYVWASGSNLDKVKLVYRRSSDKGPRGDSILKDFSNTVPLDRVQSRLVFPVVQTDANGDETDRFELETEINFGTPQGIEISSAEVAKQLLVHLMALTGGVTLGALNQARIDDLRHQTEDVHK